VLQKTCEKFVNAILHWSICSWRQLKPVLLYYQLQGGENVSRKPKTLIQLIQSLARLVECITGLKMGFDTFQGAFLIPYANTQPRHHAVLCRNQSLQRETGLPNITKHTVDKITNPHF
jgi:hypothetical protein